MYFVAGLLSRWMFEVDFDAMEDSEKSKMDRFLGPEGEDPSNLESESVQAKAGGDLPDVLKSKIEAGGYHFYD